jgi:hypothetical protein
VGPSGICTYLAWRYVKHMRTVVRINLYCEKYQNCSRLLKSSGMVPSRLVNEKRGVIFLEYHIRMRNGKVDNRLGWEV